MVPIGGATPGALRIGDEIRLRVRSGMDGRIERIFVRTTPDGEQAFAELHEAEPGPAGRWWEVTLRLLMPVTGYRFLLLTEAGHRWLNGSGIHRATPTDHEDFRLVAGHDPPGWLADRVFYQVFPDRFANGDPSNDVRDGAWTYRGHAARARAWDEPPSSGPGGMVEFFGGDLAGIEAHLDHLVDLGVNAIYLNPIFATRSNHGYDTVDYDRVADHLGGDAALIALRQATRARDIRLMLDIAPNHVGSEHPWFLDAQADPGAATAGYFVFRRRPDDYESWLGVRIAAQAGLPGSGAAGGDVRGAGRGPPPLAAPTLLDRRVADRRRQHARQAGARPAGRGGRPRHACGGQGRRTPTPT